MKYLNLVKSTDNLVGIKFLEPSVVLFDQNVIYTNIPNEDRQFVLDKFGNKTILDNTKIVSANILYYEDSNNLKLENWNSFTLEDNIIPNTIAPYNADHIGVYNGEERVGTLSLQSEYFVLKHDFGTRLYRVGLMSDVHYDDICAANDSEHDIIDSGNTWNPYEDLENALKFYEQKENIKFVACAGDISTNNIEHVHAFSSRVKTLSPNTPVYTCKGNHDNAASYLKNDLWLQYTIPTNSKYEIHYFESGDQTSFYFITENNDIYIFFNVDYNNGSATPSKKDEENNYIYYNYDTIRELLSILNTYRNQRCFVFTHLYFSQKTGNPKWDYSIKHSHSYYLTEKLFDILNKLNNYYTNSIWFSGHTHYLWKWQNICSRANICNFDILDKNYDYMNYADYTRNSKSNYDEIWHTNLKETAWNVHLPSTCRPLKPQNYLGIENYSDAIADPGSEGAVMDIYTNGVNIKGIIFANESSSVSSETTESVKLPIKANLFIPDATRSHYDSNLKIELDGEYVKLTFTDVSQRFLQIENNGIQVTIDDFLLLDSEGNDITSLIANSENPKIGYYTTSGVYSITSCTANTRTASIDFVNYEGLDFPISSSFSGNFPVIARFKGSTHSITTRNTTTYDNKYTPVANYWLPVGGENLKQIESREYNYFN